MVQKIFKISKSSSYSTGYAITAPDGTELELPESVINDLGRGKHYTPSNVAEFIDKIDTAAIALAGVTDSLNEVDHNYYMNNSVIKSVAFKSTITTICWCGKKARFNARIVDNYIVKTSEQLQLGGNESYVDYIIT